MVRQRLIAPLIASIGFLSFAAPLGAAPTHAEMDLAVRDLDADHDRATAALYALQSGGAPAARAIEAGWPSLTALGQKRAIGALRALAPAHDAAVEALVEAARSEDEQVRDLGLSGSAESTHPNPQTGVKWL